ncbi:MAG: hypothetical protein [Caudoviricetes sp.]|nr:MAG: hypothetical protein [Caudoviricetes sp.]
MAKNDPYVRVQGIDGLLLTLEGRFSSALDEELLDTTGKFVKELDVAARKVFRAMANGATTQGLRANPIMGTNVRVPGFLAEYVPADQQWEPLTKDYLKRKKRMVARGQIPTANMWKYSGDLIKYFSRNSEKLTNTTGNTFSRKRFFNTDTKLFDSKKYDFRTNEDIMFKKIPAIGQGQGSSSKGYDFTYTQGILNVKYPSNHKTNPNGYAKPQYIARMQRQVSFNLFRGLAEYSEAILSNNLMAMNPESFIEDISVNAKRPVKFQKSNGDTGYKMEIDKTSNLKLKNKLYYYAKGKRKQRGLIQPYMYYYANKIMKPLAQKLISQGRF